MKTYLVTARFQPLNKDNSVKVTGRIKANHTNDALEKFANKWRNRRTKNGFFLCCDNAVEIK